MHKRVVDIEGSSISGGVELSNQFNIDWLAIEKPGQLLGVELAVVIQIEAVEDA